MAHEVPGSAPMTLYFGRPCRSRRSSGGARRSRPRAPKSASAASLGRPRRVQTQSGGGEGSGQGAAPSAAVARFSRGLGDTRRGEAVPQGPAQAGAAVLDQVVRDDNILVQDSYNTP